ncbi:unnamed protein product [Rotaria socialis]|uniref:Uncharacterized protein n=1 Tax=Rotaria socialis TaxID=392032 RepID=A0A820J801_9BILA|nr:unnamed protein product [Rotaria socialis]CAF3516343.1 unnamed protein product [Rotaria socialis]CAF4319824.1 unnamed protein product [Rotaria socialis]CAF4645175.1 unnamed protein product [Rotaria socialis]
MSLKQSSFHQESIQKNPIRVGIRLMFQRIGEIDTLNEKYQAQALIEARWLVESTDLLSILSPIDQHHLNHGKSVTLTKYSDIHWHPQLFIENALGDLKEQIRYSAKKTSNDQVFICEHRDIKGVFWEKLELNHFPSDIQELTISVGSMFYDDRVVLIPDSYYRSGINREAFVDQQEWSLYENVDAKQRFIKEFAFNDNDDETLDMNPNDERKRSVVSVSCHTARRSAYFYWNGYCLIFLITTCAFCIFSMPPNLPQNRLQTGATLLLTSITFRWTVNRSLPTVSYLTSLDKYAIISIFILILLCVWHAIIGAIIFIENRSSITNSEDRNCWIDRCVFFILFGFYIIMHLGMLLWLYLVPLARRRNMKQKDIQYKEKIHKQLNEVQLLNQSDDLELSNKTKIKNKYTVSEVTL